MAQWRGSKSFKVSLDSLTVARQRGLCTRFPASLRNGAVRAISRLEKNFPGFLESRIYRGKEQPVKLF
jgi:hypothetical protein